MCNHKDFDADVTVVRLEDSGKFMAEMHVKCKNCNMPFQFVGLPTGLDLNGATIDADATEVRLAIVPYGQAPTILDGLIPTGFSMKRMQ